MRRRIFLVSLATLVWVPWAHATPVDGITAQEANQALRDSLAQSAKVALAKLGKENGYYANPHARIGLPKNFTKAERVLRALGKGKRVDDLVLAMNRAAEMAAPKAEVMVLEVVRKMTVQDAKAIIAGGDNAATAYFRQATETQLTAELMPVVGSVTEKSDLARSYKALASTLSSLAGIKSEQATVEGYVNQKALEGIYTMMGVEERTLRSNPTQYANGLVGKVFTLSK
jgi:hypothetical protein